ncbi:hypothetical protein [Dysgonomonas sp. 521]|uniref:hypothetical protein n=1 Tax=Dysgonomonas sp. 521 TaxID=2302932 RepID=UPI0013D25DCA|nr:hypothetical protein [Dysgonomonas sp. 521]
MIKKQTRAVLFVTVCSLFIVGLWFVRNIIATGYLVYPLHEIDLFSYDWKMPEATAKIERWIIHGYAREALIEPFKELRYFEYFIVDQRMRLLNYLLIVVCVSLLAISPFIVLYSYLRKKTVKNVYYLIYLICFLYILYWAISAPDFRFSNGMILATIYTTIIVMMGNKINRQVVNSKMGKWLLTGLAIVFLLSSVKHIHNQSQVVARKTETKVSDLILFTLYRPYPSKYQDKYADSFDIHKLNNNISIYLSTDPTGKCYDQLPATSQGGIPFLKNNSKIQSVKTIEARGELLKYGFRTKKEYMDVLDKESALIISKKYE